jgi:prepilin-type N-terminal cleavage/methylation domain-containing protein
MNKPSQRPAAVARQAGMSIIELLVVMAVIGMLCAILAPMYLNFVRRAEASKIVTDFHQFETFLMQYHSDFSVFPPDRQAGEQVPELRTYSGDRLKMNWSRWQYDWDNWVNPDGTPLHASTGIAYGFTVVTTDARLVEALFYEYKGDLYQTTPDHYTFMIEAVP